MKLRRYSYLLLVIPFLLLLIFISTQRVEEGKPKVIIRFDDYGVWCNHDWLQIEEDIIRLHEKYDVKLTYAVIPDSRYPLSRHLLSPQAYPVSVEGKISNPYPLVAGSKRVEILKESTQKGFIEVALHGYYHPKGYNNTEKNTEFYNIPYDIQYFKISEGKRLLDSLFCTDVTTFIPPHNTYDYLTLDLIHDLGFSCISAKQHSFDAPFEVKLPIKYLWQTVYEVSSLERVLKKPHSKYAPIHVLALHHTNFTTDGLRDQNKINSYEDFLKYISENGITNYTFSGVPEEEMANNDLFSKVLFQRMMYKLGGGNYTSKVLSICKKMPISLFLCLLYLSVILAIIGVIKTIIMLSNISINRYVRWFCIIIMGIALLSLIIIVGNSCSISIYDFQYALSSVKVALLLFITAISYPFTTKRI